MEQDECRGDRQEARREQRAALRRDSELAESTLARVQADARRTLGSLQELVRGIHPPMDQGAQARARLAGLDQLPAQGRAGCGSTCATTAAASTLPGLRQGLRGLADRIEALGGRVTNTTNPGIGTGTDTTVTAVLPVTLPAPVTADV